MIIWLLLEALLYELHRRFYYYIYLFLGHFRDLNDLDFLEWVEAVIEAAKIIFRDGIAFIYGNTGKDFPLHDI